MRYLLLLGLMLAIVGCCVAQSNDDMATRDMNAENAVAAKFVRLRQSAGLPLYTRLNGINFATAACQAAHDNKTAEQRFENSTAIAFIYSADDPESSDTLTYLATRPWKHVRNVAVGVCRVQNAEFRRDNTGLQSDFSATSGTSSWPKCREEPK